MKLKFFTIPIAHPAGAEAELNRFLGAHRISRVEKEFVADGPASAWSVVVTWVDGAESAIGQSATGAAAAGCARAAASRRTAGRSTGEHHRMTHTVRIELADVAAWPDLEAWLWTTRSRGRQRGGIRSA